MATQTRRTTRRSAKFLRATIKAYMVVACCGLVLLSTVSSYAATLNGLPLNGLPMNGLYVNGISTNALIPNGLPVNGLPMNRLSVNGILHDATKLNGEPAPEVQHESLPFTGLSQTGLGNAAASEFCRVRHCLLP